MHPGAPRRGGAKFPRTQKIPIFFPDILMLARTSVPTGGIIKYPQKCARPGSRGCPGARGAPPATPPFGGFPGSFASGPIFGPGRADPPLPNDVRIVFGRSSISECIKLSFASYVVTLRGSFPSWMRLPSGPSVLRSSPRAHAQRCQDVDERFAWLRFRGEVHLNALRAW